MYIIVKSLRYTLGTNIIWYVNCTSIKKRENSISRKTQQAPPSPNNKNNFASSESNWQCWLPDNNAQERTQQCFSEIPARSA